MSDPIGGDGYSPQDLLGHLSELHRQNAPERLYVAGDVGILQAGPRVSVVGSRKASKEGLALAADLSTRMVKAGIVVVSGLAEGVDTAAHAAAISANGKTIAVLGTPLDRAYPASNRDLQHRIMREHLAISQFAAGARTYPSSFPERNRTMALISQATIIVEAGEKSGTRHQGWEALRLGRQVFFSEQMAGPSRPSWVSEMEQYGATVLPIGDVEELRYELPDPSIDLESALAG